MELPDVVLLSRIQFALTIMFHYLFPPLTIGLGVLLVWFEGIYLWTKNKQYEQLARFFVRLFSVTFALGVASGIVMEFQFGTNWATYSRFVGDVFGSALAAEGIFAFFLESGFLAVLVFGWDRVSPRMHFFSACMVALGSIFSAVWIVVANSWQQTPAGYHIVADGSLGFRAEITDFWAMVFNPSSVQRLSHTLVGAFIQGAFLVASVCAWYLLRGRHVELAKRGLTVAVIWAAMVTPLQLVLGHSHARQVAQTQPAKLAAFEGHFKSESGPTGIYLFGWPNVKEERVDYGIKIPGMLSLMVHDDLKTPVKALDQFPKEDRPPVLIPFLSFHIMVGLGMGFIGLSWYSAFLLWRGKLWTNKFVLWAYVFSVVAAAVANQLGWIAAEVGRQPWVVYGLLRTADGVSKTIKSGEVLASMAMFGFIYLLLFAVWVYVMNDKIQHGPLPAAEGPSPDSEEAAPPLESFLTSAAIRAGAYDTFTGTRRLDQGDDPQPTAQSEGAIK